MHSQAAATVAAMSERTVAPGTPVQQSNSAALTEPERRHAMIAEAAHYRAERRGFEPGQELADRCCAQPGSWKRWKRSVPAMSARARRFCAGRSKRPLARSPRIRRPMAESSSTAC
jgi:hypothetical protein